MLGIKHILNIIIVCIIIVPGCLEDKSKDVDKKLNELNHKIKSLEDKYDDIWNKIFDIASKQDRYETYNLDISDKNYQLIDTNIGYLLIACENIKKHLDGYKLIIRIINPLFVRYNGIKLKVTWGNKYINKETTYNEWKVSLHEKEIDYKDNILYPGVLNKIEFIISPAKPDEITYLNLSIKVHNIVVYR